MIPHSEVREQVSEVLPFDNSSRCLFFETFSGQREREYIRFRLFPFGHGLLASFDPVTEKEGPVLLFHHAVKLLRCVADRI